ncbi:hypothetical protein EDB19DRAFT_405057 [Suillus lakei]|nr:hypothetical protein EDB19DRAFT_405057 [Suillus lakei]
MVTIPRASLEDLPTELVLLILKYAAQPTFAQPDKYDAKNPYSTARKICLVSKAVRRIALPEMLHTVLLDLSQRKSFRACSTHAKEYALQYPDLCFAYTRYIRNIWIGESGCPSDTPVYSSFTSEPLSDLDLMAPVVLGAPSLAIDFSCVVELRALLDLKAIFCLGG